MLESNSIAATSAATEKALVNNDVLVATIVQAEIFNSGMFRVNCFKDRVVCS